MRVDPAGWPFIGGALVLAIIGAFAVNPLLGIALLILGGFFLFFFRDPDRVITQGDDAVLSPADGRVMVAGAPTGQAFPAGQWKQISIFLSPMDVHVNRMPIGGTVTKVEYHPGRFLPAYRADAGDLNEYTEVWLDHGGQTIVVRQIVGMLARRIVCRTRDGEVVKTGDRFGVMKFGSRMDVFLPATATVTVRVDEKVIAGVTVIAKLAS
ncbi:MAG: phosphatidylserine decarboxylase family protein [Acidobacteria bacterium]|nr:phosphatidylserine decarboxylase family protein [Acidobacteriota bacterium]